MELSIQDLSYFVASVYERYNFIYKEEEEQQKINATCPLIPCKEHSHILENH